jgi:hypothetical protein
LPLGLPVIEEYRLSSLPVCPVEPIRNRRGISFAQKYAESVQAIIFRNAAWNNLYHFPKTLTPRTQSAFIVSNIDNFSTTGKQIGDRVIPRFSPYSELYFVL